MGWASALKSLQAPVWSISRRKGQEGWRKRCSTTLAHDSPCEMSPRGSGRDYHSRPKVPCVDEAGEKPEDSHVAGGGAAGRSHAGTSVAVSY